MAEVKLGGYAGRILHVNLSSGSMEFERLDERLARSYIGGSSLAARHLFDSTAAITEPLASDNLLIFMAGPLTGTEVPNTGRHVVVTRSPLTRIWGEANVGGTWGAELKKCGLDGIIIVGMASKPSYICIENGKVEVRDAASTWGRDVYDADEVLRGETHEKAVVSCIGPAGEKLVKMAGIFTDGKEGRAAARCGVGAVMGSKNLKAIVLKGSTQPKVARLAELKAMLKDMLPSMAQSTKALRDFGTPVLVIPCEKIGDMPLRNWSQGVWEEGAAKISGQRLAETILVSRYYCERCIVGCGRVVKLEKGPYSPVDGAGPEYETLGLFGGAALVDDLEAISKANELCNRYGLDTVEVGSMVAFAIECYENGLIKEQDSGVPLRWGSAEALLELVRQIGEKRGIGALLGEGLQRAAAEIGGLAQEFAIHTKGLALPAHDPRAYNSVALGYATSNRGACHLQGFTHVFERNVTMPELGIEEVKDRFGVDGKGKMVAELQDLMCVFDSLVMCKFTLFTGAKLTHMAQWLNMVTGWDMSTSELMKAGERGFNLKRMFNVRCGISRKDDWIPPRILVQKRGEGGAAENLPPLNIMLGDYYKHRGWSQEGIPLREKLAELELIRPRELARE